MRAAARVVEGWSGAEAGGLYDDARANPPISLRIFLHLSMPLSVFCQCDFVYVCTPACLPNQVCLPICLFVCLCVSLCLYVCLSVWLPVHQFVSVLVSVCVCVSVSVSLSVFACVSASASELAYLGQK